MKSWLNFANEGFSTNSCCGFHKYMHEGKYYNDGGGQGGIENVPWAGGK